MIEAIPLLPEVAGLVAHFATRTGGVSRPPYDSLNLGLSSGDERASVLRNRERLAVALEAPLERWVVGGQVHGAVVARVNGELRGEGALAPSTRLREADAVYLVEPGIFALALSADCPLVAIVDPLTRRAGLAHAGWRGTAAGIVESLVAAFVEDGSRPESLHAAISPGICGKCYRVGRDVLDALRGRPGAGRACQVSHVDLRAIHRAILDEAGILSVRVHGDCSACTASRFFSHRRDRGRTGRNGALLGWRT